jgi:hypothetical protein
MTGRVQSLRSNVAGNRPTGRQPGELYVNWPDAQLGVINNSSAPQDLIAVRFYSIGANYNVGDFTIQGGQLYRCVVANAPGAFNPAQWAQIGGSIVIGDVAPSNPQPGTLWWDSVGGQLYVWFSDANSSQWVIAINMANFPTITLGATPPINPMLGAMWWDSVGAQLYIFYNDGTSSQWVPTTNQMGGGYLPLSGGSLSGGLNVTSQLEVDGAGASPIAGLPGGGGAALRINKGASSGANNIINAYTNSSVRWQMVLGNSTAESGGNAGSDFQLSNWNDTGTNIGSPIIIIRATGAVNIYGTSTNDNAAAGYVGEVISSVTATPVTLTANTANNIAAVVLTPGDWDVMGELWVSLPASSGATIIQGAITATSATMPAAISLYGARTSYNAPQNATSGTTSFPLGPCRVQNTGSPTYYLVVNAAFTTGPVTVTGKILARRMR